MGLESGIAGAHHVRQDTIKASTYMSYLCHDPLDLRTNLRVHQTCRWLGNPKDPKG